eukprot:GEMP01032399.1.p1 GENE.GEMP01032399.1~~GEMP01032399.1.p1  ORF type:complete len:425 (+),score=103.00 GEMP01032399.1:215-1489(+)
MPSDTSDRDVAWWEKDARFADRDIAWWEKDPPPEKVYPPFPHPHEQNVSGRPVIVEGGSDRYIFAENANNQQPVQPALNTMLSSSIFLNSPVRHQSVTSGKPPTILTPSYIHLPAMNPLNNSNPFAFANLLNIFPPRTHAAAVPGSNDNDEFTAMVDGFTVPDSHINTLKVTPSNMPSFLTSRPLANLPTNPDNGIQTVEYAVKIGVQHTTPSIQMPPNPSAGAQTPPEQMSEPPLSPYTTGFRGMASPMPVYSAKMRNPRDIMLTSPFDNMFLQQQAGTRALREMSAIVPEYIPSGPEEDSFVNRVEDNDAVVRDIPKTKLMACAYVVPPFTAPLRELLNERDEEAVVDQTIDQENEIPSKVTKVNEPPKQREYLNLGWWKSFFSLSWCEQCGMGDEYGDSRDAVPISITVDEVLSSNVVGIE